ncbi:MAG TPA: hypothetical protein VKP30_26170 [Polyangiaceae bacterium]|nr:hypothetical protein [Polyangiaceae bacterium]
MKLRRKRPRNRRGIRLLCSRRESAAPSGFGTAPIGGGDRKTTAPTPDEPSSELLRVLRGEMTEQEYLAGRVEEALSHVKGRVSKERLEAIRHTLLMKLEIDPVLLHTRSQVFRRRDGH